MNTEPFDGVASMKRLYPDMDDETAQKASEALDRYLRHTLENLLWIEADAERYAKFRSLTRKKPLRTIKETSQNPPPDIS